MDSATECPNPACRGGRIIEDLFAPGDDSLVDDIRLKDCPDCKEAGRKKADWPK